MNYAQLDRCCFLHIVREIGYTIRAARNFDCILVDT